MSIFDNGGFIGRIADYSNNALSTGFWSTDAQFLSKAPATVLTDNFETFSGWTDVNSGTLTQSSAQIYDGSFSAFRGATAAPGGATKLLSETVGRSFYLEYLAYQLSGAVRVALIDSSNNGYGLGILSTSISAEIYTNYAATTITSDTSTAFTRESGLWYKATMISKSDNTFTCTVINASTGEIISNSTSIVDSTYLGGFNKVYISGGSGNYYDNIVIKKFST